LIQLSKYIYGWKPSKSIVKIKLTNDEKIEENKLETSFV
jgi:hypothetical protein